MFSEKPAGMNLTANALPFSAPWMPCNATEPRSPSPPVARTAKVSQWLVYADGVREYITAAREAQATEPARTERIGRKASEASIRTDLELARQDTKHLEPR